MNSEVSAAPPELRGARGRSIEGFLAGWDRHAAALGVRLRIADLEARPVVRSQIPGACARLPPAPVSVEPHQPRHAAMPGTRRGPRSWRIVRRRRLSSARGRGAQPVLAAVAARNDDQLLRASRARVPTRRRLLSSMRSPSSSGATHRTTPGALMSSASSTSSRAAVAAATARASTISSTRSARCAPTASRPASGAPGPARRNRCQWRIASA